MQQAGVRLRNLNMCDDRLSSSLSVAPPSAMYGYTQQPLILIVPLQVLLTFVCLLMGLTGSS